MKNIKMSQNFGETQTHTQKTAESRTPLASLQHAEPVRTTDR